MARDRGLCEATRKRRASFGGNSYYGLRDGGEKAADVPRVFGRGRAPGEGRPDPEYGLSLSFGWAHRTAGVRSGARPEGEGGLGARRARPDVRCPSAAGHRRHLGREAPGTAV